MRRNQNDKGSLKAPLPPPPLVTIPKKAFKGLFVTKKGFLRGLPPPNYKALKDPLWDSIGDSLAEAQPFLESLTNESNETLPCLAPHQGQPLDLVV